MAILALAGGCSLVRLGYNQAPDLAYWWLDGYYDFNEVQQSKVRESIATWFAWHRKTQLPDYAVLLDRAQAEVQRDATPAQMCRWNDEFLARANIASDQALPALADLVLSLAPEQFKHLQKRLNKDMKEFESDYLQPSPQERAKAAVKRVVDRVEMLYGSLDDGQRQQVIASVAASPFDPVAWGVERVERQKEMMRTLQELVDQRADKERAQAALRTLSERAQHSPSTSYRAYQQRLIAYNCAFAAQMHNATNAEQRQTAANRFKGWAEDARALAAQTNGH